MKSETRVVIPFARRGGRVRPTRRPNPWGDIERALRPCDECCDRAGVEVSFDGVCLRVFHVHNTATEPWVLVEVALFGVTK